MASPTDNDATVATGAEQSGARRRTRRTVTRPIAFLIAGLAIEASYVGVLVDRGFFFADDFNNFDIARVPFTFGFLATGIFGHFIPLFNLLNQVLVHFAPYNFPVTLGIIVAMYLAALTSFYRITSLAIPESPNLRVALTLVLGTSLVTVPGTLWWSNAASNLPTICFTLAAIDGAWRYLQYRKIQHAVMSGVALIIALGFFESGLIAIPTVVLLWSLFVYDRGVHGNFSAATVRAWKIWVALAVPAILDLGFRASRHGVYTLSPKPSVAQMAHFLKTAWASGFAPGVIGVDYPYRLIFRSSGLTVLVGELVMVALVIGTLLRYRSAWKGWVFFAFSFLIYLLATGFARAGYPGSNPGLIYDYLFFGPYLLFLGFALSLRSGRRTPSTAESKTAFRAALPGSVLAAVALVVVGSSVASAISISNETDAGISPSLFENPASPRAARLFFDEAQTSLSTLRADDPHAVIFDTFAPDAPMGNWFDQYRPDSEIISDVIPSLHFGAYAPRGYVFDGSGALQSATFGVQSSAQLAKASVTGGVVVTHRSGGTTCAVGAAGGTVALPFPDTGQVALDAVPLLRLTYTSTRSFMAAPLLATPTGSLALLHYAATFPVLSGGHSVLLDLNRWQFSSVELAIPARTTVCLTSVQAGQAVAGGT